MTLPQDPVDIFVLAAMVVLAPFILYRILRDTFSGFLPPERVKMPKAGKLEKILSPQLKDFVASLPRPAGDPLARVFEPAPRESLPYYDNWYARAVYPLWKTGERYSLAIRYSSRREKEHTEFVWTGMKPSDQWDSRAESEQGFLAETIIELLRSGGPAAEASRALGFRHLDETKAWFMKWSATDWSKPVDEDDEDDTPAERSEAQRFSFVRGIDEREK